jgi:hypothetical protein
VKRILRPTQNDISADQLSPMAVLIALLTKHMPDGVDEDHLSDLCAEAIAVCGSVKKAIRAIETGRMKIEKMT